MISANLLVGFLVAVALATGLLCVMLWQQGLARGLPRRRLVLAVVQIVANVMLACAVGMAARTLAGGEVLDIGRSTASGGLWLRPMETKRLVAVVDGVALMAVCMLWALRVIRSVTVQPEDDQNSHKP